jgi:MFS family permease
VIARYRTLFSVPGFTRLLVGSILGRLPSGMFSLAILLFVHGRTGSFLYAGIAVGSFALAGAAVGPALGALVDRAGQTRVLIASACTQAAMLALLVVLVHPDGHAHTSAPVAMIAVLSALAGAVAPPIAGCVRALWSQVAGQGETLQTAYALDATAQELIWTLGPLLVGSIATLVSPAAAVLACAAITLCGTAYFGASELSSGWQAHTGERTRRGALSSPGLRVLLATVALSGVVIGAVEVGLPALAVAHRARWSAGPLAPPDRPALRGAAAGDGRLRGAADRRPRARRRLSAGGARRPGRGADALLPVLAHRGARPGGRRHRGVHVAPRRDDRRHGRRLDARRLADPVPRRQRRVRARLRGRGGGRRAGGAVARAHRPAPERPGGRAAGRRGLSGAAPQRAFELPAHRRGGAAGAQDELSP